ncbi:MAG: hydrolase [Armatimonadetes bacterium]|nr:hydrolase [Armatimonadota bacterium]
MEPELCSAEGTAILLIDVQPSLVPEIHGGVEMVRKAQFLCRAAKELGIPVMATEQNPSRLGETVPELRIHLERGPLPKMTFSCCGCAALQAELVALAPKQLVIAGIETHICVLQTVLDLLRMGHRVFVVSDATGARSQDRHELGLRRMERAGAVLVHSESAVYEWLGSAQHLRFRQVLSLVKETS